jgi:cell division protein FtsI/penicillin-binding protein 2
MDPLATKRVHVLVRVAFLWAALIVARLIQLQVVQHPQFAELAREQQQRVEEIKAPRGAILDRYGQRLAMSLPAESVVVDPLRVPDLSVAAEVLSRVLNLDARDLLVKLKTSVEDRRGFLWVKRKITRQEAKRLRSLNLEWIEFRTESQRFYPNRSLAAHVIGSVDFEENGNGGIEQSMNDQLAGHAGEMLVTEDVQRRGFASSLETDAQPGQDVQLTIDSRI